MSSRLSKPLAILAIILLGLIVYSNTFYYPFHFDDELAILSNCSIKNIRNLKAIWDFRPNQFVSHLSFALNYHFNKLNVFGYHLINILIHISAALSVWYLVSLTFLSPAMRNQRISRYAKTIACFSGLLFAGHPIQTEAVTYIVQRTASLAALFYLVSLCLYAKARLAEQSNISNSRFLTYYALSLFACLLAMFSKEIAFSLPLMVLVYEFYFFQPGKLRRLLYSAPYFIILAVIIAWTCLGKVINFKELGRIAVEAQVYMPPVNYLLTQFSVLLTYIRLLFLPFNQTIDYDYPISQGLLALPAFLSLLLLIAILLLAFKLYSKHRLLSFCILWFFICLSVESSIIPLPDVIFEHRLYLPLAGYSLFISVLFGYLLIRFKRQWLLIGLFLAILSCYSVLTYKRNFTWRDEFSLWNDAVSKFSLKTEDLVSLSNKPAAKIVKMNHIVAALINRAGSYLNRKGYDKAISDLELVLKINPNFQDAYFNRGIVYFVKGEYDSAISEFNKLLSMNKEDYIVYNWRGRAHCAKGQYDQAIWDYEQILRVMPNFLEAYLNRGIAYRLQGEYDKAISDYNRILELDRNYIFAYVNRGYIYFIRGDYEKAVVDYTRAIQIDPKFADAYYKRAKAYLKEGLSAKAERDMQKVRDLGYEIPGS